jgi:soluble lytic murein transglycosylase
VDIKRYSVVGGLFRCRLDETEDKRMMRCRGIQSTCYILIFTSLFLLITVFPVNADIYMYIDDNGVMHFTNAPTTASNRKYKVFIRERSRYSSSFDNKKYDHLISDASRRYGVSVPLLKAIVKAESDFNPRAVSKKGAKGLMQIMPENFELLDIKDPFDPKQNIMGGTRYFKQLYERFNGKLALSLAAYNAGPTVVDQYQGIPPYQETEQYIERVLKYYRNFKNL